MHSIKEIFVIGHGPSSSHTMGPANACEYIINKYKNIKDIKIFLYGSLALTGKGHLTDYVIDLKLKDYRHMIIFDTVKEVSHPNTMKFIINTKEGIKEETILSIGGGSIRVLSEEEKNNNLDIYSEKNLKEILKYCEINKLSLVDYVLKNEGEEILDYLKTVYDTIEECRQRGISKSGFLPGKLKVNRKARDMYLAMRSKKNGKKDIYMNIAISSFAVSEENASGGIVVIAPTCGSSGVIPGVITYLKMKSYSRKEIIRGLLVAGLIGMIAKTNASISGAECGCQAEIGVACAMGAALISTVEQENNDIIAQSAEIAMEHSLGLTCDPVDGYVQIPCIERCAIFALKAVNAATLAKIIPSSKSKVSFDQSLQTMLETGKDLNSGYRETSIKGLAKLIK